MKRAKILVATILVAGSAPIGYAGKQPSPPAAVEVRNAQSKGQMSRQTRSDIRDQVLDTLRETLKQSARSGARDIHSECRGMTMR